MQRRKEPFNKKEVKRQISQFLAQNQTAKVPEAAEPAVPTPNQSRTRQIEDFEYFNASAGAEIKKIALTVGFLALVLLAIKIADLKFGLGF